MDTTTSENAENHGRIGRNILANLTSRQFSQILLALSMIIVWAAVFCVFLEGKSSYDLAFTLWDDEYDKVPIEPMGRFILPQFVMYAVFLIITAIFVAIIVNSRYFKQITAGIIILTAVSLVSFVIAFGNISLDFIGGRQGTTGWTILEYAWLSLLLLCSSNALGMIGMWFLISQEIPRITTSMREIQSIKRNFLVFASWTARILIILVFMLGSLALNAGAILTFNHVNAAFVIAATGCVVAMDFAFFKKDIFQSDFKKKKQVGKKQTWLFTPDPIVNEDGTELNRSFDFRVNPRNIAWRYIRNLFNGILTAVCIFMIAAMCFMAVPDEWVFSRFLDLLPWMALGALIGTGAMAILPEPAIYFPAAFPYFAQTYNNFLANFDVPFDPGFIALNGGLFGFWIAVLVSSQFYMHRAKSKGRNFNLTMFLMLTFSLTLMILCFVDRFQHDDSSWNRPITAVLDILLPLFGDLAQYFLYLSIGFAGLDISYRIYCKYKPVTSERLAIPESMQATRSRKSKFPSIAIQINISDHKKRIVALLVIGIFIGSFSIVQGTNVYGSEVRPLLYRGDDFGIWTVDAVTKVEKSFQIQMPGYAPMESNIGVAAARGEWNGFHVLISPQPGKSTTLSGVTWTPFSNQSSSSAINASIMEVFLVAYFVDEQPDQLLVLPPSITRSGGEHVDLYFRLLVPRNATAGIYDATIHLTINALDYPVDLQLRVYDFTIPADNHLRTSFGGGWDTSQWYGELKFLRISQQSYDTIPFTTNVTDASIVNPQYWWNNATKKFNFNWTAYDIGFKEQLKRGFTGIRQGYFPTRPKKDIPSDSEWVNIKAQFLRNVSRHLENYTWIDKTGTNHSWVEIPYLYDHDEPSTSEYPGIKEEFDRYHANGTSKLRTLLTEEYNPEYPILDKCIDEWCPVIGNFDPSDVDNRHAKGQQYWFYTCVAPVAPYPNLQLWEQGNDPELLPCICARFNADGYLYWSMTAGNDTYRAGYDGNGDGQVAYNDTRTGRLLPSLRLLSFSLGVEDFECIWLLHATIQNPGKTGSIPSALLSRAAELDVRLNNLVGARPQFVNHDPKILRDFKADLSRLLEDLWPYSKNLYS